MYINEPLEKAQAVVIWLHGLGSNAENMQLLATELRIQEPVRHVFLQAPDRAVSVNDGLKMPAWYDITGPSILDRQDLAGIQESMKIVHDTIASQIKEGFSSQQIFLAGFSQGGAVALFSGLSYSNKLGGLMVLSGYLPCQEQLQCQQVKTLPMFFGIGQYDDMILPHWTLHSVQWVRQQGYHEIINRDYDMAHSVCAEELEDMSSWLEERIQIQKVSFSEGV